MTQLKHRGFTLIELMAVVFIIGVILTFATISVGQHSDKSLEEEAKRLHYLIKLASEESVLRSTSMAMEFTKQGYQFVQIAGDKFEPMKDDNLFRKREFPGDMKIQLELYGQEVSFEDETGFPEEPEGGDFSVESSLEPDKEDCTFSKA